MQGQPRKLALVAPENAEYQESVNLYLDLLGQAGISVALNLKYKLDISSMPNQASNIIAQLKDNGITTVLCGCDPVMRSEEHTSELQSLMRISNAVFCLIQKQTT